jgi:D-alanyl-D-alanine carboxypeptidase
LVVVVVLAVTLSTHGGSVAAAAARKVAGPAPGVAAVTGAGTGGGGTGSARQTVQGTEQGAVAPPRVQARAVILADESTGQVLFERNASSARAMASTTKVMTALLALERLDERKVVVIGSGPPQVGEESLRLRQGERLTVRQLLLGLLVKSANDAGAALAEAVDGNQAAFVRRMNRKAAALRLSATHYVTPYGLDRPGHQTSARDLARLWEVAMRRADFRSLVATKAARIPGRPLSLRRFVTTNQLLGPGDAWSPRPAAAAAGWSWSRSARPTPSRTCGPCSTTASPSSSGSALPSAASRSRWPPTAPPPSGPTPTPTPLFAWTSSTRSA